MDGLGGTAADGARARAGDAPDLAPPVHPDVLVVDASVHLAWDEQAGSYTITSGREGYLAGHVPGAVFADVLSDFSDPDAELMFALPGRERIRRAATALGIGDGVHVVVYTQDLPTFAPRLWWLLGYYGFDAVSVLDGGLAGWRAAGLPVTDEPSPVRKPARPFEPRPRPERLATLADVEAAVAGTTPARLVHALSEDEYRGLDRPADPRAGHIPSSVNVPWYSVLDERGRYLPPVTLDALATARGVEDDPVITYCGGGIAASMTAFALTLAGRKDVRVYDGSLAEWTADPDRPIVRD